jgi:hypothetical protein
MNAYLRVAIVAIVASCGLDTAEAGQQQSTYHKPMAPIGPTSDAQCQALEAEWSSVCEQISAAHQQCLDANTDPAIKRAGACDKAPCLALHIENESCGGAERTQRGQRVLDSGARPSGSRGGVQGGTASGVAGPNRKPSASARRALPRKRTNLEWKRTRRDGGRRSTSTRRRAPAPFVQASTAVRHRSSLICAPTRSETPHAGPFRCR